MYRLIASDAEVVAYQHAVEFSSLTQLMDALEKTAFPYAYGRYEDRVFTLMSLAVPADVRGQEIERTAVRAAMVGVRSAGQTLAVPSSSSSTLADLRSRWSTGASHTVCR